MKSPQYYSKRLFSFNTTDQFFIWLLQLDINAVEFQLILLTIQVPCLIRIKPRTQCQQGKSDTPFKVRLKSHTLSGSIYLCSLYIEVPTPDSAPTRLGVHNTISLSDKTQHCHSTTCNIVKHSLNNRFCTMLKGVLAT